MIRLDLNREPAWLDLAPGVPVLVEPLTTALMMAARGDPGVEGLPETATDEDRALALGRALGRLAIRDWEGVGDADGAPIPPTPEAITALLDLWPLFEAFQLRYVAKGLILEQEKNVSAPSPSGTSAGATDTAPPALAHAPIVPAA
jgi:hypothetical protein